MRFSVRVNLFALLVAAVAQAAAPGAGPAATFTKALDAYFGDDPYRAIVLDRETLSRPDAGPLREPALYVLGESFASIHLYEKSEDALNGLLVEFPSGRFAPLALRELARIFFDLREYGAVVNLAQDYQASPAETAAPAEFWYLLGQSNYILGRAAQAREPLLRVASGTPFYPFARFTLAQVEFNLGHADGALGMLGEVAGLPQAPPLLREKAMRVSGMILYQQKRYGESMRAYQAIAQSSSLYGVTRIDEAFAADAAGDSQTAQRAFGDAMERSDDDLIRTEARVAVGRFLNRQQKIAAARTLFEQALGELKARETRLRQAVDVESNFRQCFDELVAFSRQSTGALRRQHLTEDLDLLRSALSSTVGLAYEHPLIAAPEKLSPKSYLFPLMQHHFHNPALIETFVDLSVEIEDLDGRIGKLADEIRGLEKTWDKSPPLMIAEVSDPVTEALHQVMWLAFSRFDLTGRFYDALAVNEKMDPASSLEEKQRALSATLDTLRLILYGQHQLPTRQQVEVLMEGARRTLESGNLPGLKSQRIRDGFIEEWRSDRDSMGYVLENLDLKQRQMTSALSGVPLRSRNINLPVLTTMTEWLTALEQLTSKYQYIDREKPERPWHLAGKSGEVVALLGDASRELRAMNERSFAVLRTQARELVDKEQYRHSLIVAEAEEGIADALFQERQGR